MPLGHALGTPLAWGDVATMGCTSSVATSLINGRRQKQPRNFGGTACYATQPQQSRDEFIELAKVWLAVAAQLESDKALLDALSDAQKAVTRRAA
jgi:hypothetical protein